MTSGFTFSPPHIEARSVDSITLADSDCFALFDDRCADDAAKVSRLYTDYRCTLQCHDADSLPRLLAQMQKALQDGLQVVTLFHYELGAAMHRVPLVISKSSQTIEPLAEVLLFGTCQKLTALEVDDWLRQRALVMSNPQLNGLLPDQKTAWSDANSLSGIANVLPNVDPNEFDQAIARIHAYIEAGDTYQVNYTFRLHFDVYGSPLSLYRQLRERQPVPYGALIALPDGRAVLSLSPELFVRHDQGVLTARPMKGTAAASDDSDQNQRTALALAADPKNRAENLMIVDLLRNDLGRVAHCGSVYVPKLFEVSRFNTVLQMTSTVTAQLRGDLGLTDLMTALYPCGSITGAPKLRSMQIIAELEKAPRRLYTGAIGWFDAPLGEDQIGDFCLSVPIRTLLLEAENDEGIRHGEMGIGAGIVYDSVAQDEYAECVLKARFLTGLRADFSLFETIYATSKDGCRALDLHLNRLRSSAVYFGFEFNEAQLRSRLDKVVASLTANGAHRLRLSLSADGTSSVTSAPMNSLSQPVKVIISDAPTEKNDLFLRHKTTQRTLYDHAWKSAEQQGAFDMLFFNQAGELTEGGRSNVFIKLAGRWYTPPLVSGLLPGVMRSLILNDSTWNATERALTREDLQSAEQVMVCNALRGAMAAEIIW
ncbi:aminodeoxychorismate synthase component I [Glaciimonas sp. CA11.2]|uniref:aminodeoxychorismate synthase component I n=1 Tax=Glaciimonas sp. CA11.2 TaxID=3048601 RepID=UPI002AB3A34A|nr:aminodeoxychorismate synthase component I [Glaciimonas sp. CA11.2]MDY7547060.1 aminodeoxychorismate synthase component I [Glaciimonas sp. CA11.2]MEB0163194.1 aminodeoxychorismate synthase component I [Glaciimonas sp. CA11.2]